LLKLIKLSTQNVFILLRTNSWQPCMFNMIAPHVVGVEEGAGHTNMSVRRVLSADKERTSSYEEEEKGITTLNALRAADAGAEAEAGEAGVVGGAAEGRGGGKGEGEGQGGGGAEEDEGETKHAGAVFDANVCPPCDPPMLAGAAARAAGAAAAEAADEFADVEVITSCLNDLESASRGKHSFGVVVNSRDDLAWEYQRFFPFR